MKRSSWQKITRLCFHFAICVSLLSFDAGAAQRWHLVYDKTGDILGVSNGSVLYPAIPHSGGIPSGAPPIQLKPDSAKAPLSTDGPSVPAETSVTTDSLDAPQPAPEAAKPSPQTAAPISENTPLPQPGPSKFASTNDVEDSKTEATSGCPFSDGRCFKKDQSRIPMGRIAGVEKPKEPAPLYGSCKLIAAAKRNVRIHYHNRHFGGGDCGGGVGESILMAGFPFPHRDRFAIKYMRMLPEYHWKSLHLSAVAEAHGRHMSWWQMSRLNQEEIRKAPPGSVLVFAGPCTPGYPHPEGTFGCGGMAGNRVGDVTIKGNDGWFYFDGKTNRAPALAHRYLVGVFVPPGTGHERCGK